MISTLQAIATATLYAALSYATQARDLQVSVHLAEGRTTEVAVSGSDSGWLLLEASTDLQSWSELVKAPKTTEDFHYLDYVAEIFPQRFYRATTFQAADNDNFSKRQMLIGTNVQAGGWTFDATSEENEPALALLETGTNSVWWSWTAPSDGTASVSTVGTFWDTLIGVFSGEELANLVPVARFPWFTRELNFTVESGKTYQIGIAGSEGQAGALSMTINLNSSEGEPTKTLAGSSVNLTPYQYPDFQKYALTLSSDAKQCALLSSQIENSGSEMADVAGYSTQTSDAALDLVVADPENKTTFHRFEFKFRNQRSGDYIHFVNGVRADTGEFTNFRCKSDPLALSDLSGVKLTGTRIWTTTGTSGQSHHYTFNHGGHFHDSDGAEQATGRYQYQADGASADLTLDYTGPADFAGDHHELTMTYTSVNGGTFSSRYTKNDGTRIIILGEFAIDED